MAQHSLPKSTRKVKSHPHELIIGEKLEGIKTRKGQANFYVFAAFLAQEEPKNVNKVLEAANWIMTMQYSGTIISLLYLTSLKYKIMYNVCICSRFQSKCKESHSNVVKRIF